MLIATAGHIDHGKTSLIRALTGVETDRLPEEKARGISIDLGFAHWAVDGRTIGFIDVPGHERFIRNMLAGLAAIDYALLVVAADDGVMPQTIEHLQILDLLAIDRGLAVITKCDRVGAERVAEVRGQVADLLAGTGLASARILEASVITGAGVEAIAEALREAAALEGPGVNAGRQVRLAIDRVFTRPGAGTVVTGTVQDAWLEQGAQLQLSSSGRSVRVRGLQRGGQTIDRVAPRERCAVNLAGASVDDLRRGDWLLAPGMLMPTRRLIARVALLPGEGTGLRHNAAIHLHLGTTDRVARALIAAQVEIAPGRDGLAQVLLERPVSVVNGDRFIIRDPAARRTLGSGRVIDPLPPAGRRDAQTRARMLEALESFDPEEALTRLLRIPDHEIDAAQFERVFNLQSEYAHALYRRAEAVLLGRTRQMAILASRQEAFMTAMVTALGDLHREQPDQPGFPGRALKARAAPTLSNESFLAILRALLDQRRIETSGSLVRLPGHVVGSRAADRALWERLEPLLREQGLQPLTAAQLALELRMGEPAVKALLYRLRAQGEVWRVTDERFFSRDSVAQLAATAALLVERSMGGKGFSAADYRDAIGTGRTLAIQILEFFDGIGVTRRNGDLRKMQPDYLLVVGHAQPHLAAHKPDNPAQPPKKPRPLARPAARAHSFDRRRA